MIVKNCKIDSYSVKAKEAEIILSKELDDFLSSKAIDKIHQERRSAIYDLLSFGGGSCPKVVGKYASRYGWNKICFLTNGSDNGGSTFDIVEALRKEYGATMPVGDITSALIALLDPHQYELLNLRGWRLDPQRFSASERDTFTEAISDINTFHGRLSVAIEWYKRKFLNSANASPDEKGIFFDQLLELGRLVDEVGLIRPEVQGLDLKQASVRHHIFNALMIRVGAYNTEHRTPDSDRFKVGLWVLQQALNIGYTVFPSSLDEQVLYAEWVDKSGNVVWSTKHSSTDNPVFARGGQVALSNASDAVKAMDKNEYAFYGRFGFDPEISPPSAYSEAIDAITLLRTGSPIIYGPSSFVASISPCLAIKRIVEEIIKRNDCPKILFLNLTLNNETIGMGVTDFLDFWELNTGKPISETVNYVVVNNDTESSPQIVEALKEKGDSAETFKFRGPLVLTNEERHALPRRGISLVEAPLATVNRQLMRLSSAGEREYVFVPNHHSARLMSLAHAIVDDFNKSKGNQRSLKSNTTCRTIELDIESGGPFKADFRDPSSVKRKSPS